MKRLIWVIFVFTFAWGGDNYLRATKLVGEELHLRFKFPIKDVHHFILPSKGVTKYIYDVKGGVLPVGKTLPYTHPKVKAFRIGQYNKEVLRIVIESNSAKSGKHSLQENRLIIPLPVGKALYKNTQRKSKVAKKPRPNGIKVVIDAGHGGKDNGASCCDIREKKITLNLAKKLQQKLVSKGYTVYMTRTKDKFLSLINRTEFANAKKADIFVSIHANAAPSKKRKRLNGIEIFYLTSKKTQRMAKKRIRYRGKVVYGQYLYRIMTDKKKIDRSKRLAKTMHDQLNRSIHQGYKNINSDLKRSDFWVLLGTKMPSILVEAGYLTHESDRKRLESPYYQNLFIKGMVNGVDNYFKGK